MANCSAVVTNIDATNNNAFLSVTTDSSSECAFAYGSLNTITISNRIREDTYYPYVIETAVIVLTNITPLGGTCNMSTTLSAKAFASLFVSILVWVVSAETSPTVYCRKPPSRVKRCCLPCRAFKVADWMYNNSLSFYIGRYYVYAQIRDVYTHAISVSLLSNVILVTLPSSADHLYVSASQMRYHYFAQRQINEYMSAMTAVMYSLFNNANGFEQVFNMSELPTQASFDADTSWYVNWMNEMIFWYEHAEMKRIDDIAEYIEALANMARLYFLQGEPDSSTLDVTKAQMIIDALTNALQLYSSQLSKYENARIDHVQGIIDTVSILLQQCVNGQKVDPQNSQYVHLISTVYSLLQSCGLHAFVDANPLECVQFDFLVSNANWPVQGKVQVTKASGDDLSQCNRPCHYSHDHSYTDDNNNTLQLNMGFSWPQSWIFAEDTLVSGTNVSAIGVEQVSCVMFGVSGHAIDPAITSIILSLELFDTTNERPSSAIPIATTDGCDAFAMNLSVSDQSLTTTLKLEQSYTVPECVNYYFDKSDNSFQWNSDHCGVVIYNESRVECACTQFNLFAVEVNQFKTTVSTQTSSEPISFRHNLLHIDPIPLIVAIALAGSLIVGWLFFQFVCSQDSLPILAYADSIFPETRDDMFKHTTLYQSLSVLFSPQLSVFSKGLKLWWQSLHEYHLLSGLCCARRHSHLHRSERWLFLILFVTTMYFLSVVFYVTSLESAFEKAFCNNLSWDYLRDQKWCKELWMVIIASFVACVPVFWVMGYFLFKLCSRKTGHAMGGSVDDFVSGSPALGYFSVLET
ncbi:hypothetical protein RFI_38122 [Reticulomyxa filosa]|uniref:Uncharacterized protein n=1 Tax=Reticulomyxa filosa TaxID=46433 RepID=X6LBG8_RETFI|nr:hypothetical protein RFI_38122 [Reticulomyxa filosa]|eukprot:ETN99357.1 hypothetical protein RFI_38122 [Reticulomyxa filosa]